jgi:hypothetical protein
MPISVRSASLSVGELERLLRKRQREIASLTRKRAKVEKKLQALDERIRAASGTGSIKLGGRAKNEVTLIDAIESAFKGGTKPLTVGEIMERVLAAGYQSTSANFRGIVNQTLIKGKQFQSAGRGLYGLKR